MKNQTKALYQATRRADPVVRMLEQSSDTERKRITREEPGVREQRREQEHNGKNKSNQPTKALYQAQRRANPVKRRLEQSFLSRGWI